MMQLTSYQSYKRPQSVGMPEQGGISEDESVDDGKKPKVSYSSLPNRILGN